MVHPSRLHFCAQFELRCVLLHLNQCLPHGNADRSLAAKPGAHKVLKPKLSWIEVCPQ